MNPYQQQQQGYPGGGPPSGGGGYPGQQPGGYPGQQMPPPGQGYPGQHPGQGYPGQQGPPSGHGYPGQQMPPPGQGYPGQQMPPPGQGYPGQQQQQPGGYGQQGGYGGAPPSTTAMMQPPPQFMKQWYSRYYQRIPPQGMQTLQAWFQTVDKDRSQKISAAELGQMTFPGQPGSSALAGRPIGKQVAAKVVELFDSTGKKEIDFFEYAAFFEFCTQLQTAFTGVDRSRSNAISAQEAGQALNQAQLTVAPATVAQLWKARVKAPARGLDLAGFLNLALDVAEVRQHFERLDTDRDGKITLDDAYLLCAKVNHKPQRNDCVIC